MSDQRKEVGVRRRMFLKQGAAMSAAAGIGLVLPQSKVWAAGSEGLEKTTLKFGIIPLTDCAAIVVAKEKGFFKKHGLDVEVSKEASWANIRDKVSLGELDGAHMLAGMPLAATLGVGATPKETITAFSMDLNGNGITVSNELYERMVEADPEAMKHRPTTAIALKKVIEADKKAGKEPMTFAMVFPVSTHNYEIRYWMASGGIDPDKDVRLIVIPPPQMVANLSARNIVGYCVGEPWNQRAVEMGIGRSIITNYEIWNNNPEKVFGVTREWADKNPNSHKAAVRALIEAAQWMDKPENRKEVVKIISAKSYVNAPVDVVENSMTGTWLYTKQEGPVQMPDFNVFYRYAATFPWRSHAVWFLTQMVRWGQIEQAINFKKVAEQVYRPDIYREAAKGLGIPVPTIDYKTEGTHAAGWTLDKASSPIAMGPDKFFDGMTFDPAKTVEYLKGFKVHNMKVALDALAKANA
ncbi:CmpA/NrtA family ABC transporter substrate-binding protein [Cognatazoarcus halotolerans]|uniref:CmpA/NrtA family ABC transporter substrate-binding protein n=1 Tax=Cognatazoarcus halotolerans TaxID=2686016 RepID=UPI00135C813B|nr:CmpA/NrtA family ABC transporter substrate-binding protein [Cognatazoarcus halotolerans]MCB1901264.1 ABC transporter substrate-binding protein [Rhodocyclaceae bacterium]MCP5308335.1 ABC transporter substrate-binding protein [Zoogloeaceae bacterium]